MDAQHITLVDHHKLSRFVAAAFEKLGVPPQDAAIAANVLVLADLRGVDTHGVIRFNPGSWYVKWLRDGEMNPAPKIHIVSDAGSSALLDGDRGIGMVVGHRAMELAIEKAKVSGIGIVGVCNSRHFGMSAYYAMQALAHDMIGIAMTNAGRQVVPTFGSEARFGTNPICFAAPAQKELPFVIDMATTTAAAGKLEVAARRGASIPLGWALNEKAQPTTDPRIAQKARRLLPLGGTREGGSHKGYGLAIFSRDSLRRFDRHGDCAESKSGPARSLLRGYQDRRISPCQRIQERHGPTNQRVEVDSTHRRPRTSLRRRRNRIRDGKAQSRERYSFARLCNQGFARCWPTTRYRL